MLNPTKMMEANSKLMKSNLSNQRYRICTNHRLIQFSDTIEMLELKSNWKRVSLIAFRYVGVSLIQRLTNRMIREVNSQISGVSTIE